MPRVGPLALLFLLGCSSTGPVLTTVRPPDLPYADTTARSEPPEVIAVRYALVQWAGAEGADEQVTRTEADAGARARMLSGLARHPGQSFRELQTAYSDGPTAQLQLRRTDERLPTAVVETAFALRVGERSSPVATPVGFYVVAREEDPVIGPTQVYVRHVLVSFVGTRQAVEGVTRTREEARVIADDVHAQAVADPSRFAELAAEFSDEPGAAESGGDLGAVSRGQTVPTFERAAFALEVGQVSAVVESPFGLHVIHRYR